MTDTTNEELLEKAKLYLARAVDGHDAAEHLAAWEEFFTLYTRILKQFARRRLRCKEEAVNDLLQDVWQRVAESLPQFEYRRSDGGFRRWLFTIVRHRLIDLRRTDAKWAQRFVPLDGRDSLIDGKGEDPTEAFIRQFDIEVTRAAILKLKQSGNAKSYEILTQCLIQERSVEQVAQELGIKGATARKRLQRARAQLRHMLQDIIGDGDDLS